MLFEVHIDTLDRAMGEILVLEGHLMVFEVESSKTQRHGTPLMRRDGCVFVYLDPLLVGNPFRGTNCQYG